jgi:cell division protein FtsB
MARLRPRLHITLLVITVIVMLSMAAAPARQVWSVNSQIAREEQRLEALREENARLEARLERLEDPDYLEKLARERLGLVKPGEKSYVVVPPPPPTSTAQEDESGPTWIKKIFDWFGNQVQKIT